MGKWRQGLNFDRGATKQRAVLFKNFTSTTILFKKKFLVTILLHSR